MKQGYSIWFVILAGGAMAIAGCLIGQTRSAARAEQASTSQVAQRIPLPAARQDSTVSVEQALSKRRSCRQFTAEALALEDVSQLLWAAQGVTDAKRGYRTAPSAGALFPLEAYLVVGAVAGLEPGLYHYAPGEHSLALVRAGDLRDQLYSATYEQSCLRDAAVVICLAAVYERTSGKYGAKAPRFVHMEIGHAGQNVCLQAVALGLGAVTVGGFDDAKVQDVLALPALEMPLYFVAAGRKG